jgi:hypothetical protein
MATDKDFEAGGEQDHISKLAFSAVATPDNSPFGGETRSDEVRDLDQYVAKGSPATRKEVISYYAYVRVILIPFANSPSHGCRVPNCYLRRPMNFVILCFSRGGSIRRSFKISGISGANLLSSTQATMVSDLFSSMLLSLTYFLPLISVQLQSSVPEPHLPSGVQPKCTTVR